MTCTTPKTPSLAQDVRSSCSNHPQITYAPAHPVPRKDSRLSTISSGPIYGGITFTYYHTAAAAYIRVRLGFTCLVPQEDGSQRPWKYRQWWCRLGSQTGIARHSSRPLERPNTHYLIRMSSTTLLRRRMRICHLRRPPSKSRCHHAPVASSHCTIFPPLSTKLTSALSSGMCSLLMLSAPSTPIRGSLQASFSCSFVN